MVEAEVGLVIGHRHFHVGGEVVSYGLNVVEPSSPQFTPFTEVHGTDPTGGRQPVKMSA